MAPTDGPSSSKAEQEASKERSDTRDDIEQEMSTQDQIQGLKEEVRILSANSLSLSIRLGKAKGAAFRDLDLINRLEDEYESIQLIVTQEKKVIKELEEEVGKEQKEKHNKLLESLTDALPSDRRGAQMDDDDGSATE